MGEPIIADAIMGRLLHSAHTISFKGESMRGARREAFGTRGTPSVVPLKPALPTAAAVRRRRRRRRGQAAASPLKPPKTPSAAPRRRAGAAP